MGTYSATHGKVTRINGTGFELDAERWINISKYARPLPPMPSVGDTVVCTLDAGGFARKILKQVDPERDEEAMPDPSKPATVAPVANHVDAKDLRITRLACINSATSIIAGNGGRANSDEVLALAAKLEAWVLR